MAEAARKGQVKPVQPINCLGLFAAIAVLIALLAVVLVRFSMPRPARIDAGPVQEYSPGQAPRFFFAENMPVYVVNIDGEVVALKARADEHLIRCTVKWQAAFEAYVDPCLGTWFSLRGEYRGKGPPGELRRLPLSVQEGEVWVELGYQ